MRGDRRTARVFLLITAICIAISAVWSIVDWRVDSDRPLGRGEASTSDDGRLTLAVYELDAGDTIYHEYEASEACWFIIYTIDRTDPVNTVVDERLNLSGTQNSGSYECPVDEQYYLMVTFLGTLPEGTATIDYYTHGLNDFSVLVMVAKTAILMVLTAFLAYFAYGAYRWGYGGLLYKGLGVAGGTSVTAWAVIDYLYPSALYGETYLGLVGLLAAAPLGICFWVGLFTVVREEEREADAVIQIRGVQLSLWELITIITMIGVMFAFVAMLYVFNQ